MGAGAHAGSDSAGPALLTNDDQSNLISKIKTNCGHHAVHTSQGLHIYNIHDPATPAHSLAMFVHSLLVIIVHFVDAYHIVVFRTGDSVSGAAMSPDGASPAGPGPRGGGPEVRCAGAGPLLAPVLPESRKCTTNPPRLTDHRQQFRKKRKTNLSYRG